MVRPIYYKNLGFNEAFERQCKEPFLTYFPQNKPKTTVKKKAGDAAPAL
jgi:hypothetical protein